MDKNLKNELITNITNTLEDIRPYLQQDGGDVELVDITDNMVIKVKLLGACGTCPTSIYTLKIGIEKYLKKIYPEIKEVVSVNT